MADVATGSLKKPKTDLYRSFLYLNGDEVLNSLAGLEGGGIEEVLTRTAEEGGSELGAGVQAGPVQAKGGKKRGRKLEEEIRRKRTEHSAATTLLRRLHEEEAIGVLEGAYGPAVHGELEEHMLLEFRADVRIHPLHQVIAAARGWLDVASSFGTSKVEISEVKQVVKMLETLTQSKDGGQTLLAFAEAGQGSEYRLVLPIQERFLLVPLDEFEGNATFVAQVDRKLEGDDEVLAVRLIRNAPQLGLEREGLAEGLPEIISSIDEVGITTSEGDFFLRSPAVILRPLVIYK